LENTASGVLGVLRNSSIMAENELALRWVLSGMSVMLTSDSNTVLAAKGSKNMLNSAYWLEGTENIFPLSLTVLLMCPPTTYTSCDILEWLFLVMMLSVQYTYLNHSRKNVKCRIKCFLLANITKMTRTFFLGGTLKALPQ